MLSCEGYKMFRGTGEIHHAKTGALIETQDGDWLYKPEYNCWYVNGHSYPAECVKVVEDETKAVRTRHGRWVEQQSDFDLCGIVYYECSECKREQQVKWHYCPHCGARMGEAGNE